MTPDSFSDGGRFLDPESAATRGTQLIEEGAEILDIGGESSRPGAQPVTAEEELRRVIPVIEKLAGRSKIPLSIDTMKPAVAREALQAGANIVNDVGANREDDAMWRLIAETGAGYVCMHMQGTPQTMQQQPAYADVVAEVRSFFEDRLERLRRCGVAPEQVILDPGIGFGKTVEHNLQLLAGLREFAGLERPLMIGASRKSFLGKVAGGQSDNRLPASLICAGVAVEAGVQIVRAHDVQPTVQAIRMVQAILGAKKR